jgi:hypothetical protein
MLGLRKLRPKVGNFGCGELSNAWGDIAIQEVRTELKHLSNLTLQIRSG